MTLKTKPNRTGYMTVSEVLAALMKGPRTTAEIVEMVDCSAATVRNWLQGFHASGIVRIAQYIDRGIDPDTGDRYPGKWPILWELQTSPFALPDAVLVRDRRGSVRRDLPVHAPIAARIPTSA